MVSRSSAHGHWERTGGGRSGRMKSHCLSVRWTLPMQLCYVTLPVFRKRLSYPSSITITAGPSRLRSEQEGRLDCWSASMRRHRHHCFPMPCHGEYALRMVPAHHAITQCC